MNKYLLILSALLVSITSFGQKIKNEKVEFRYVQYPSAPFPKAERLYKIETETTSAERAEEMKKNYEEAKAKIDARYEADLADLRRRQAQYDSASAGAKIATALLLGDTRPTEAEVKKGSYPKKPMYPKEIDGSTQVNNNIKIEGLTKSDDANVTIKFSFNGMDYTDYKIVGDSLKKVQYTMKNPVKMTVTAASGEVLYDAYVPGSNDFTTITWGESTSYSKLSKAWGPEREKNYRSNEKSLLSKNMKAANSILNSKFGYVVKEMDLKVFMGASKKDIYPEHAEAFSQVSMGYNMMENEDDYADAKEYFDSAIAAWEETLKEKDPKNKKAKVNAKVTGGMHFNLASAYLFTKDFKKVKMHTTQLKILGEGKFERQLKQIDDFIDSYKSRYEAYQKAVAMNDEQ
ncbi:hypothetical protein KMW28_27830 [Flammeovirga yaeyamensis]|uniref:Tetratricopeptide repeat protein n=1 Tax=Flammeovirga yaeyamensis TaxID=367791 RepID=A0AAX1NBY1_9BACT|nr:hypothetical protein [Flammeovirga yaeyamensis]MBB3699904.1 hypothetical protein [Flammeovirga yaeyamensis]NMF38300.1 hypothetical protein [Flammeovirga yaeyamensis]QWG04712.1 hypothetical protein KMW28_27830 [Flammeovirga yaeyamensis]